MKRAVVRIWRKDLKRFRAHGKKGDTDADVLRIILDYMDQAGAEGGTTPE